MNQQPYEFKPFSTLIIPTVNLTSWVRKSIEDYSNVAINDVDIGPLIDLELECLLINTNIRHWSSAYDEFFEQHDLLDSSNPSDMIIDYIEGFIRYYIIRGWGCVPKSSQCNIFSWSITNDCTRIRQTVPTRLKLIFQKENKSYASINRIKKDTRQSYRRINLDGF